MKPGFNIVIFGVGGQGVITLTRILSEAALAESWDVKTSELHGLSQRGGAVSTHIRFGAKVWSPLVRKGTADLVISLEAQEAIKGLEFALGDKKTTFLVNEFLKPVDNETPPCVKDIQRELERFSSRVILEPANQKAKQAVGKEVLAGIYLLGYACYKKIIPLQPASFLKALKKTVPEKYLSQNKKVFNLSKTN